MQTQIKEVKTCKHCRSVRVATRYTAGFIVETCHRCGSKSLTEVFKQKSKKK